MAHSRYALYLTPPLESDLWAFGCAVIGRDAATGRDIDGFAPEGHDAEAWKTLTSEPRRYGFHATLVAPFQLRADLDRADLFDGAAAFARTHSAFEAGAFKVGRISTADGRAFVALKPSGPAGSLRAFAEKAVRKLDGLRAPLTLEERRKREAVSLTPLQRYYLDVWGYPTSSTSFARISP